MVAEYYLKDFQEFLDRFKSEDDCWEYFFSTWAWQHKLRRVMVRSGREKPTDNLEVNETFVGGKESCQKEDGTGKTGRGSIEKGLVVVATDCLGKQLG